jgi:hypothetical protein
MSDLLIHALDTAWMSSNPAALQVTVDPATVEGPFAASNLLVANAAAQNATAAFQQPVPLDLSSFDELRFWIIADRIAEGTARAPYFLEFSYIDAGDAPGEEHRWFVSINMPGRWEQRRIGIANDRRSAVTSFRFRSILANPFVCHLNELLAVFEQMLPDAEQALITALDGQVVLPRLSHLLLKQPAAAGANQIVVPLTSGIAANNRIRVDEGSGNSEIHDVAAVSSDAAAGSTTMTFAAGDVTGQAFAANVAFASVIVPVIIEAPPSPAPAVSPSIVLTMLDAREDLARSTPFTQRDSFRPRGSLTFASVRPGPRAYFVDYQVSSIAPDRAQQIAIQSFILSHLSMDIGLRINGSVAPVQILPPTDLLNRHLDTLAPSYVRIGTHQECAPRIEMPWVVRTTVQSGLLVNGAVSSSPVDQEGIVQQL